MDGFVLEVNIFVFVDVFVGWMLVFEDVLGVWCVYMFELGVL